MAALLMDVVDVTTAGTITVVMATVIGDHSHVPHMMRACMVGGIE